jgi:hypothetical protein
MAIIINQFFYKKDNKKKKIFSPKGIYFYVVDISGYLWICCGYVVDMLWICL